MAAFPNVTGGAQYMAVSSMFCVSYLMTEKPFYTDVLCFVSSCTGQSSSELGAAAVYTMCDTGVALAVRLTGSNLPRVYSLLGGKDLSETEIQSKWSTRAGWYGIGLGGV